MDWLKTLERFFGVVAVVIPGAAVLTLFGIHHPDWAAYVRDINYIGYRTKISLVVGAAFIAGWTVTTVFMALVGGLYGVFQQRIVKWLYAEDPQTPPWRNKNWRALVTQYLGSAAPEDLDLIGDDLLAIQVEVANCLPDPTERFRELYRVKSEKGKADIVENYWKSWWSTLHHDAVEDKDPVTQVSLTIEGNLQATSLLLLCAIPTTPVLNRWWVISFCLFWLFMRLVRMYSLLIRTKNPWSTFTKQMDYLRSQLPGTKAKAQAGNSQ
jgi:hypothetical protein